LKLLNRISARDKYMRSFTRVHAFISLTPKEMLLLLEAYFFLGWARILKLFPFAKVAPSLGDHMKVSTQRNVESKKTVIKNISHALHIMSRYTFWESQCLVKAIAGMKMLERRGIESTLYLGTARDVSGHMIAHAWLRSGSYYISGAEEMGEFTVVSTFASLRSDNQLEGESYE
jgi:hypothetical protein